MRDSIDLGPTPAEEDCAQRTAGNLPYAELARLECAAWRDPLRRTFGLEPDGASLRIVGHDHDYGRYDEVAVRFDDANQAAVDYAYRLEAEAPGRWDAPALEMLGRNGRADR
jgi:hypothetical protein